MKLTDYLKANQRGKLLDGCEDCPFCHAYCLETSIAVDRKISFDPFLYTCAHIPSKAGLYKYKLYTV